MFFTRLYGKEVALLSAYRRKEAAGTDYRVSVTIHLYYIKIVFSLS